MVITRTHPHPTKDPPNHWFSIQITPSYWEGAMQFTGTHSARGYLEMTGYDNRVRFMPR